MGPRKRLSAWDQNLYQVSAQDIGSPRTGTPKRIVVASCSLQTSANPRPAVLASTTADRNLRLRCPGDAEVSGTTSLATPRWNQMLKNPLAVISVVPKELSLFFAGAVAGAAAKTVTAPFDRVKILMQVRGVQAAQLGVKNSVGFLGIIKDICKEEGLQGLWKGNLPQVVRIIPYSAVQLFTYDTYKRILRGDSEQLSVTSRLVAGACAGMTSTLVTYPLDTIRLRMAVDPASKRMGQVILTMMKQEGLASFYRGLGPSLLGIAPYIALNFTAFDIIKNSLPGELRKRPESSLVIALASASFATAICYPLDTVRRQLQMKDTPFKGILDAFAGIIEQDKFLGLYRGFLPNVLKNLPSSSIRLATFEAAKGLISVSKDEYHQLGKEQLKDGNNFTSESHNELHRLQDEEQIIVSSPLQPTDADQVPRD